MLKGFTFSQLAVILLVILGLVVAVVIASTQLSDAGSKLTEIGNQVGNQDLVIKLGTKCFAAGGFCKTGTSATDACEGTIVGTHIPNNIASPYNSDCPIGKYCCK